jgi:CheY-like chemotaxis protein
LLALARRQTLAPEPVDLNGLVEGMHELVRRTLGEHIKIELRLAGDLWTTFADHGQLENALLNLVVNARDAMPDGGKLMIETANMEMDATYAAANEDLDPGEFVVLAVTDTGFGMPSEISSRAFEPFFTTKDVGKGSGLGLSMIYGFAHQSKGHAKIYSEEGHGTTVRIFLPREDGRDSMAPLARASDEVEERTGQGEIILVVEDDKAVREFVVTILDGLNYRVLQAVDGAGALAILESEVAVDLLFTDVVIPGGMSGRQVADRARELRPGLKVVFTSGYTRNSVLQQGKLDDSAHFIAKPYRVDDLATKIRAVLDSA